MKNKRIGTSKMYPKTTPEVKEGERRRKEGRRKEGKKGTKEQRKE
jgi:hypothetical protein